VPEREEHKVNDRSAELPEREVTFSEDVLSECLADGWYYDVAVNAEDGWHFIIVRASDGAFVRIPTAGLRIVEPLNPEEGDFL